MEETAKMEDPPEGEEGMVIVSTFTRPALQTALAHTPEVVQVRLVFVSRDGAY
jgi:hypothetical protein